MDQPLAAEITPRLLSLSAMAAYCGMSPAHFDRTIAKSVLPLRFGHKRLWDRRAVDRWLDAQSGIADTKESAPSSEDLLLKAIDARKDKVRHPSR